MTLWKIYLDSIIIDLALFPISITDLDVLEYLIQSGRFDSRITVKKSNDAN